MLSPPPPIGTLLIKFRSNRSRPRMLTLRERRARPGLRKNIEFTWDDVRLINTGRTILVTVSRPLLANGIKVSLEISCDIGIYILLQTTLSQYMNDFPPIFLQSILPLE